MVVLPLLKRKLSQFKNNCSKSCKLSLELLDSTNFLIIFYKYYKLIFLQHLRPWPDLQKWKLRRYLYAQSLTKSHVIWKYCTSEPRDFCQYLWSNWSLGTLVNVIEATLRKKRSVDSEKPWYFFRRGKTSLQKLLSRLYFSYLMQGFTSLGSQGYCTRAKGQRRREERE